MDGRPEVWLRGPIAGIPAQLQPTAHALVATTEDIPAAIAGLTPAQIWVSPGGAASIGFHLLHLAGSTDRLFTYARGEALSGAQMAVLDRERALPEPRPDVEALVADWQATVDRALRQLAGTAEAELDMARTVGRAKLPSTVRGLLCHAAEHAARHAGQIVTTARIVAGLAGPA